MASNLTFSNPANRTEAQFSLEYAIATIIEHGSLDLTHLEDKFVKSSSLKRVSELVYMNVSNLPKEEMNNKLGKGKVFQFRRSWDLKPEPLDKKNPEDVDTKAEDHLYDALRYGIMTRPRSRSIFDYDPAAMPRTWNPADRVFGY